jgi:hypothetical protein
MKGIKKRFVIPVVVVVLGGILLWGSGIPSRSAKRVVPGTSFETVLKLLGPANGVRS